MRRRGLAFEVCAAVFFIAATVAACGDDDAAGAGVPAADAVSDTGMADVGAGADAVGDAAATCQSNAECSAQAIGPCVRGVCEAGSCRVVPVADHTPCDDADLCTLETECAAGVCQGGFTRGCEDGNACTADSCDPQTGCRHTPLPAQSACDDGDPCTQGDACSADGVCAGDVRPECVCAYDADCAPHEDGNLCNGVLRCVEGRCRVDLTTVVTCGKAGACRKHTCNPSTGQCATALLPDGSACSDKNPCTLGDACDGGTCRGQGGACECATDEDCKPLQPVEYDLCQGPLVCLDGACAPDPAQAVTCPAGTGPCTTEACDPATGLCATVALPDGSACQGEADGAPCVGPGACKLGTCQTPPADCDDGNPCTTDGCDPDLGCVHVPTPTAACDDGDPCTTGEVCDPDGACGGGVAVVCDDAQPCTVDQCDPEAGGCVWAAVADGQACDDGNACTTAGVCAQGVCVGQEPVVCEAAGPCQEATCAPDEGCVVKNAASGSVCDDGDPCTKAGVCKSGECQTVPVPCSDGNPCTLDACDPLQGGCVNTPMAYGTSCAPANPCLTGGTCQDGQCVGGQPVSCLPGPCDSRKCDPESGACVVAKLAPDGSVCGEASACMDAGKCLSGECVGGGPKACDDGDACTADACDPDTGKCVHTAVVCVHPDDACLVASCAAVKSVAGCQAETWAPCDGALVLWSTVFACGADEGWSFALQSGQVGFAIDALPDPPGAWDDGCSLNLAAAGGFAAPWDPTTGHARSPGFQVPVPGASAVVEVSFREWFELREGADVDRRWVRLVDGEGKVAVAAELPKTDASMGSWGERTVALEVTEPGPWHLELAFDSVVAGQDEARGWLIDRLVVATPAQ